MNNRQTIVHPLAPFYNKDSQILILGSFPSVKTREYGFFYGHAQNRFWPLLARIFKETTGDGIAQRQAFLAKHHIALYDVIYQCDIIGSSDASIQNVVPANLNPIFEATSIQQVFCNGATSFRYFQKYQKNKLNREAVQLPSTSPANARASLDVLYQYWKIIKNFT
ncbi:MAG: DNA-deoxyinosine glycosylase [Eubacteriales bacterium]|nr:DNA-deoxyinosine glycosylase [Eubacteriales bacterium]